MTMSDEKRLIKYLLENYERVGIVGRPVYNTSETVRVNYGLALIQILDLDEKNQVLTTNVWSRYVSTLTLWVLYSETVVCVDIINVHSGEFSLFVDGWTVEGGLPGCFKLLCMTGVNDTISIVHKIYFVHITILNIAAAWFVIVFP